MSHATPTTPPIHSSPTKSQRPYATCLRLPWARWRTRPSPRSITTVASLWPSRGLSSSMPMWRDRPSGPLSARPPSGPTSVQGRSKRPLSMALATSLPKPVISDTDLSVSPIPSRAQTYSGSGGVTRCPDALNGHGSKPPHPHGLRRSRRLSTLGLTWPRPCGTCRSSVEARPSPSVMHPHLGHEHVSSAVTEHGTVRTTTALLELLLVVPKSLVATPSSGTPVCMRRRIPDRMVIQPPAGGTRQSTPLGPAATPVIAACLESLLFGDTRFYGRTAP